MGLWDWVDDFNESAKRGFNQWASDPLGETGKYLWNYVNQPKADRINNANKTIDYFSDPYPKSEQQFRNQQMVGSIPLVGQWYTDYLRSRNLSDWQAQMRQDYGIEWGDTKYPWLSDLWSANPNATAVRSVANAGVRISKNLKKLYQ